MSELVSQAGGALAIPQDVLAKLAEEAKAAAAVERPAISRISLKSGVMTFGGQPIAGNKMEAVILAASFRNVWYAGRYDPNNIVNPNCFALSETDEGMAPHPVVSQPPHATCQGCPKNEWGSDPNGGRGKACKQTRRLVLIPGTAIEDQTDPVKATQTAEMAVLDLPVTSVKNYSGYVNSLAAATKLPPYAAIAQISVVPDAKTQFKVQFQPMRAIPSMQLLEAVQARLESAKALALEPYEETNNADPEEPAPDNAPKKAKKY